MKIIRLLLLLYLCNDIFPSQIDMITNYLNYKHLRIAYLFSCLSKLEEYDLSIDIMRIPAQISIFHMRNTARAHFNIFPQINNIAIIVNSTCPNVTKLIYQFDDSVYFNEKRHWLIIGTDTTAAYLFDRSTININSDVTLALSKDKRMWDLFELYNTGFGRGGHMIVKHIGYFNKREGLVSNDISGVYRRRKNLAQSHFKVAGYVTYPYNGTLDEYMTSETQSELDTLARVGYMKIKICMEFYNTSWTIKLTDSYGYLTTNTTFNGIIGELQKRTADFGMAVFVRPDRMRVVDYGAACWIVRNSIIFRDQGHITPYLIYIRPLTAVVWYVIIAVTALILLGFRFILKTETSAIETNCENTWSALVIYMLASLCQQGASGVPNMFSGRILLLTISLFSVLLYQLYSASIVSSLLIRPPARIKTLADLVKSNIEVGCEDAKYTRELFATTTNPVLVKLRNKKIRESSYMPPSKGLSRMSKGGFAYHIEESTAYPHIERTFKNRHICELQELKIFDDAYIYMTHPKESPFKDMLNFCVRRLDEVGISNRFQTKWLARKPRCFKEPYLAAAFGFTEFLPLATLLFAGMICSLVILMGEMCVHRFSKNQLFGTPIKPFVN